MSTAEEQHKDSSVGGRDLGVGSVTNSWFSPVPRNFEKFLEMTRSTSRSLSPERELQQLTSKPINSVPFRSPLWDPVEDVILCWNNHKMRPASAHMYRDLTVVCDFCTKQLPPENDQEEQHEGPNITSPTAALVKKEEEKEEDKKARLAKMRQKRAEEAVTWVRCSNSECGIDLCGSCVAEIRRNIEFHKPCMKCLKCDGFVAIEGKGEHQCPRASLKRDAAHRATDEICWALKVSRMPSSASVDMVLDFLGVSAQEAQNSVSIWKNEDGSQAAEVHFPMRTMAEALRRELQSKKFPYATTPIELFVLKVT